ncbi:MAG: AraC family ligand binding domain-containing protein [Flammeovirgaceae bacterium]|nr:AraC family ligand binding domain-containing protein [Flammeovirgaceae bacterium]
MRMFLALFPGSILLITEGGGWVWHNEKKFLLKPNHLYLIPRFTLSKYHCDNFLNQYYIHFLNESEDTLGVFEDLSFQFEEEATSIDFQLIEKLNRCAELNILNKCHNFLIMR